MDVEQVKRLIRAECDRAGSASAWAARIGVTRAWVSAILLGRREPGPAVLEALGLEKAPADYRPTTARKRMKRK